eukprot:TRINITY_DN72_c0_g2_i13.p1 TRINITY_DN72_c0_g2~~TRINITY_DN72_c0_g2_i13.p1  ORF type:complete len:480 (-),score=61.85 TRINITY_DN72_c0_g2_i13:120-1559(-)
MFEMTMVLAILLLSLVVLCPARAPSSTPSCNNAACPNTPNLLYTPPNPVMTRPKFCNIFWGPVSSDIVTEIPKYMRALLNSNPNYFTGMMEYGMTTLPTFHEFPGCDVGITLALGSDGQTLGTCKKDKGIATYTCVTEGSVFAEMAKQISKGTLPPGDVNTLFVSVFPSNYPPPGIGNCDDGCGIHMLRGNINIAFHPDFSSTLCKDGCLTGVTTNSSLDGLKVTISHELVEAITDPNPGGNSPGWYSTVSGTGEVADMCTGTDLVNGHYVQQWWSQTLGECVTTHTPTGQYTPVKCNSNSEVNCYNYCCPSKHTCGPKTQCVPPTRCEGDGIVCSNGTKPYCVVEANKEIGCATVPYTQNCLNGYCCQPGQICASNPVGACVWAKKPGGGCPVNASVDCGDGTCCTDGTVCDSDTIESYCTRLEGLCPPDFPVDCNDGHCCPANFVCTADGYCESNPSAGSRDRIFSAVIFLTPRTLR